MTRRGLYVSLALGCIAGYVWLFYSFSRMNEGVTLCLFKRVTGIPCPACGSTRAIMELIRGNLLTSLTTNPNGFVLSTLMLVLPVWLLWDVCKRGDSLYRFYIRAEQKLKGKFFFGVFCLIVVLNWMWNIYKEI